MSNPSNSSGSLLFVELDVVPHERLPSGATLGTSRSSRTCNAATCFTQSPGKLRWLIFAIQLVGTAIFFAYEIPVLAAYLNRSSNQAQVNHISYGLVFLAAFVPIGVIGLLGSLHQQVRIEIEEARKRTSSSTVRSDSASLPPSAERFKSTAALLYRLFCSGLVAVLPFPLGKRSRTVRGGQAVFPWMSLLLAATWILLYIVADADVFRKHCSYSSQCPWSTPAITLCNFAANFIHFDAMHLVGNTVGLLLFALLTESARGGWRSWLPVALSVPLLQPMYRQCGTIGGSGILGVLAGSFCATWFAQLATEGALNNRTAIFEGLSGGLFPLALINFTSVASEVIFLQTSSSPPPYKVAHWAHAEAQVLGFVVALIFAPVHSLRKPEQPHNVYDPMSTAGFSSNHINLAWCHTTAWSVWWNWVVALIGVGSTAAFITAGWVVSYSATT